MGNKEYINLESDERKVRDGTFNVGLWGWVIADVESKHVREILSAEYQDSQWVFW